MVRTRRREQQGKGDRKMLRGWSVGIWGLVGWLLCGVAWGQEEDWKLRDRDRRQKQILRRFQEIVEKKPDRGFAFQRMVEVGRRWPGLDRLVAEYRKKVKASPRRLAYSLILGHLLDHTGQREGALRAYEQALRLDPQNAMALQYKAAILQKLQRYEEAIKAYETALGVFKDAERKRRAYKALGTLWLLRKQPKKALGYWKQFLQMSPNNLLAREELAREMGRNKLYEEALLQWKEVLKRRGGGVARAGVLRQMGGLYEEMGKWPEAVGVYRQAMVLTQESHWLRRELSARVLQLHRENGKLAELAGYLQQQKRKSASDLSALAQLYDEMGRDKEAREMYAKALLANSRDSRLRLRYITLLEVGGDVAEGVKQYRLLIRNESSEPRYRMAFAEMLSRAGKQKESLAEMAEVARRFSRNTEILSRLAALYRRRRMHKEANALLRRLIAVDPRDPAHRNALGTYHFELGQKGQAQTIWRGILRSGLGTAAAYTALGQIYRSHNLDRDALEAFRKAARAAAKDPNVLRNLGEMFRRLLEEEGDLKAKELQEAIEVWKKIHLLAKLRPAKKEALRQLFALYHAQGTSYRLPVEYRQRLRKRPSDIEALRLLGEYYLWLARKERRDHAQARRYFERILDFQKDDIDAILTLEDLEARQSRWYLAKRYLLRAVEVDKKGRRTYYRRLYEYSLKLRQYQDAIQYARRVVELYPDDATAHAELARVYRKVGRAQEAVGAYQEALRLQPHNHGYHQTLGHLYRDMGQTDQAIERYNFVLKHAKEGNLIYDAAMQIMGLRTLAPKNDVLEVTLQTLSEQNPRELAYFRALAELYQRQGRMKEYRVAYLKAASSVDDKSQVYKKLAEAATEQGDLKKAIIYYRKMLEETPNPQPDQQMHLARLSFQVGDQVGARKLLFSILTENPNSARILRQVGELFDRHQLAEDAIYSYELFLELQPMESAVRVRLAELYLQKQMNEPAMGLLESVFWQEEEKALRSVAKKTSKPKKANSPTPSRAYGRSIRHRPIHLSSSYYARRMRYMRLYQSRPQRIQALGLLLELYAKAGKLEEWDRRVELHLRYGWQDTGTFLRYEQTMLLEFLAAAYRERGWDERLRKMYEVMHEADPQNARWSQELAKLYIDQGLHEKAKALMFGIHRGGVQDIQMMLARVRLLVQLREEEQLTFQLRSLLYGSYTRNHHYMLQVLQELRKLPNTRLYEMFLRGLLQTGVAYYREAYQQMLVSVYLQSGKQDLAQKMLMARWKGGLSRAPLKQMETDRLGTARLLWPLLSSKEQEKLLQDAEQGVTDALLGGDPEKIRQALVTARAAVWVGRGQDAAQAYLPAMWSVGTKYQDGPFLRGVLSDLLRERQDIHALKLIKQEMAEQTTPHTEMGYLYSVLTHLSSRGGTPEASLGRYLEKALRRLHPRSRRPSVIRRGAVAINSMLEKRAWLALALRLGEVYLKGGDPKRGIWWLEACRWLDSEQAQEPALLNLLYEAYQEQGMNETAARYREKTRQAIGEILLRDLKGWELYLGLGAERDKALFSHIWLYLRNSPTMYTARYQLQRPSQMLRYQIQGIQRMSLLESYKVRIAPLAALYSPSGEIQKLVDLLKARRERVVDGETKRMLSLYVMGAYLWDWETRSTPSSLKELLARMDGLRKMPHSPQERFHLGLWHGRLLGEMQQPKQALAVYRELLTGASPAQERQVLLQIAEHANQASEEDQEKAAHVQLARKHNEPNSYRVLAQKALEAKQIGEAVRYFRGYMKGHLTLPQYRSLSGHLKKAEQEIQLAQFLLGVDTGDRVVFHLLRAIDAMRLERNRESYLFSMRMQQTLRTLQQAGRLEQQVEAWEKTRKETQVDDPYQMMLLSQAYGYLGKKQKRFEVLTAWLYVQPYEQALFRRWKVSFEHDALEGEQQKILERLRVLYAPPKPKPGGYDLFFGDIAFRKKRPAEALVSWKLAAKECSSTAALFSAAASPYRRNTFYARSACVQRVCQSMLKAGLTDEALQAAKDLLKKESSHYTRRSGVLNFARVFLAEKGYRAVVALGELLGMRSRSSGGSGLMTLDNVQLEWMGHLAQAQKGLGQEKERVESLFEIMSAKMVSPYQTRRQADILKDAGMWVAAEYVLWRAQQSATASMLVQFRMQLCDIWQRQGVGALCGLDQGREGVLDEGLLALRAEKAGLLFIAMLLRRRAWLRMPRQLEALDQFLKLSLALGRKEESAFLQRIRARWFVGQPPLGAVAEKARESSAGWELQVPAYCKTMSVQKGRLDTSDCTGKWSTMESSGSLRCQRRVVRAGRWVLTNDCRGRLVAVEADGGKVAWVKQLVQVKTREVVERAQAMHRSEVMWLDRHLNVADIRVDGEDVWVAINEAWFEWGNGWVSGIQHRLHLLRVRQKDGAIQASKVFAGNYVRGRVHLEGERLLFRGRRLYALSRRDATVLWESGALGTRGTWLLDMGSSLPLVVSGGYVFGESDGFVRALRLSDGGVLWSQRLHQGVRALDADASHLVVVLVDGSLWSMEAKTGKLRWKAWLRSGHRRYVHVWWAGFELPFREGEHALLTKAGVLASTSDGWLALFDQQTGKPRWEREVGEIVWHAPRPLGDGEEVLLLGQMGTASRLRLSDGALLWKGRFSQMPQRGWLNKFHHSQAIAMGRGLLFGAYQEDHRFVLRTRSFVAATSSDSSKEKVLSFVRQLRAEGRSVWADRILSYAADAERGEDQVYFSALSASGHLSKIQRLRWITAKLRYASDLRGALLEMEPMLRTLGVLKPPAYFAAYDKQAVKDYATQFLLYYWLHRKRSGDSMETWWQLVRSSYRVLQLDSPFARRVMALLLTEGTPVVRWWAAATLAAWGSSAGHRVLLQGLAKRGEYRAVVLSTLQQDWVMRILVHWSYALRWEGLLGRRDLADAEVLLRSYHPLVRNLSALFIADHLSKERPEDQRFDTPLLRATLRRILNDRGVAVQTTSEAQTWRMQAAIAMARLGERVGIEGLRLLVRQSNNATLRNRAARSLFFEFGDASGRSAIFDSVQGTNQKNLRLPSFQLIYANNLLGLKEYRKALTQFRKVHTMPTALLSVLHQSKASWGMVRSLAHLERYDEALQEIEKLKMLDPAAVSHLPYIQGYIFWKQGKDSLARPLFERFMREHPYGDDASQVREWLARSLLKAGRAEEAIALFTPIFERDRGMRRLYLEHYHLARALSKAKVDPTLARVGLLHIRKALELQQDQPRLIAIEASLLHLLGQFDQAKRRLLRAIQLDAPQSPLRREYQNWLQTWEGRKVGLNKN